MGTPQNTIWGLRGSQSARPEPQNAWDSFLFAVGVPEASKGDSYFHMEMMVLPHAEVEVEEVTSEGHKLEVMLPQQQIPWRRGRPIKNKEVGGGSQILIESCARSVCQGAPNMHYLARACQNSKSRKWKPNEKDISFGF
jgi:hypothetical protein